MTQILFLRWEKTAGRVDWSSNMTLSVNHTRFVLLLTHTECIKTPYIAMLSCHGDGESLYWFNKFNARCITGECQPRETHKSNSSVPLKHDEAFPMKGSACSSVPSAPAHPPLFVYQHQQQSPFSNENHSSQSSLPETKGQCNLGKLLKLQSNLL